MLKRLDLDHHAISDSNLSDLAPIQFHHPYTASKQTAYVAECMELGRLRAGGKFTKLAQSHLREMFGNRKVVLTNSCTAAMEIMALALDIGPSDEVIIPTFTFSATATAFARTGARLVLADIDPSSMMVTDQTIRGLVTPKTKAIVVVHYGGFSANIEPIQELCDEMNIALLEDAAQGLGVKRNGQHVGGFGLMGALSFHETKVAHCGQGGALIVNSEDVDLLHKIDAIVNRGTNFADFAANGASHYEWTNIGSSFEMTEMQAAVLTSQLEELHCNIMHRQKLYGFYSDWFSGLPISVVRGDDDDCNGHFFGLLLSDQNKASRIINEARDAGVSLQSHYKPLHLSDYGKRYLSKTQSFNGAETSWDCLVRLPIHIELTMTDASRIASFVTERA